ncbi:hypothetical protein R9C00_05390 [Flammeovirgaceae bacterium SG7u.111]|nr:hypothetical protein [Flammeovirgaceae bacterium SG7u.132]WPO36874.1 hypothetical protein R9C00_05390 [Flammeovirgaceae bacterium SG7u.111]
MKNTENKHTFHIPVMGIGFTIDAPVKVAHYGISSVISLVDDKLIEKMRKFYAEKFNLPFQEIAQSDIDCRAKRITSYLNLVDKLAKDKFQEVKDAVATKGHEIEKYIDMLPDFSELKQKFNEAVATNTLSQDLQTWVQNNLSMGSIDVNIMTKLDREYYDKEGNQLPIEYNDAHAALRGFAESNLEGSVVLSAGMNPRLYSYIEKFEDFYPDENGYIKKKIILKVSDYRSSIIQGKFLAKKGIWVSEYRVESGLNCGGHAFATDGFLMGPILEEFKGKRTELKNTTYEIYSKALGSKDRIVPAEAPAIKITAQGGVGTSEEHEFLMEKYGLDAVGWGSPFLLVPEVVDVDGYTRGLLKEAKEEDLYLSGISPLGVPFNNLRGNSRDIEKQKMIDKGRPGSSCPNKNVEINKEFTEKPICVASRQYQHLKIKKLDEQELTPEKYKKAYDKIVEKSCICVGLGTGSLLVNNIDTKREGPGVSVCPGPNLASFNKTVTLQEMVGHIYGRLNIISRERPNMFMKELKLYINYLKDKLADVEEELTPKELKYFVNFQKNLQAGIAYYKELFGECKDWFEEVKTGIYNDLESLEAELMNLELEPTKVPC